MSIYTDENNVPEFLSFSLKKTFKVITKENEFVKDLVGEKRSNSSNNNNWKIKNPNFMGRVTTLKVKNKRCQV